MTSASINRTGKARTTPHARTAPNSGTAPNARMARPGDLEPFEVFQQAKDGDPMRHGGNVMAPDAELALHYAREMFGRRQESTRLWVVRRADIAVLEDPDLLDPPLDRSFKKPGGYVMRDKLAAARERAGTSKPAARSEGHDRTGGRRAKDPA